MTPKEKAKELFDYFFYKETSSTIYKDDAIDFALFCVDQIMNCGSEDVFCDLEYWQEVKQEIEKL